MLATQTTVSSRYGVYSAHRVLYEQRPGKREQLLGTPVIDDPDPVGDIVGGWALVGVTVESLREPLEDINKLLTRHPELRPLLQIVLDLLGVEYRDVPIEGLVTSPSDAGRADQPGLVGATASLSLGKDPTPESNQASLPMTS